MELSFSGIDHFDQIIPDYPEFTDTAIRESASCLSTLNEHLSARGHLITAQLNFYPHEGTSWDADIQSAKT